MYKCATKCAGRWRSAARGAVLGARRMSLMCRASGGWAPSPLFLQVEVFLLPPWTFLARWWRAVPASTRSASARTCPYFMMRGKRRIPQARHQQRVPKRLSLPNSTSLGATRQNGRPPPRGRRNSPTCRARPSARRHCSAHSFPTFCADTSSSSLVPMCRCRLHRGMTSRRGGTPRCGCRRISLQAAGPSQRQFSVAPLVSCSNGATCWQARQRAQANKAQQRLAQAQEV